MIKNKITKIASSLVLCCLATNVYAFAGGMQNWPVYDDKTNNQIRLLGEHFKNNVRAMGEQAKMQERNTYTQNLNQNQLAIFQEQKKVILEAAPTLQKCVSVTQGMGLGRANSVVKHNEYISQFNNMKIKNVSDGSNFNSVTQSPPVIGTCSKIDVQQGVNGCKKIGAFSGLDTEVGVLKINRTDGSMSLNQEQIAVAEQYITNFVYALAPRRPEGGRGANSSLYNALLKVWQARVSPVQQALTYEMAYKRAIPITAGSSLDLYWNSNEMKSVYKATNADKEPPKQPSMKDLIDTTVSKDFFNGLGNAHSQTGIAETLNSINNKLAIQNYLSIKSQDNQFLNNNQLGSIAMGMYSPLPNSFMQTMGGQ